MAVFHSHVCQRDFPTVIQYCRQRDRREICRRRCFGGRRGVLPDYHDFYGDCGGKQYRLFRHHLQSLWSKKIQRNENGGINHIDNRFCTVSGIDGSGAGGNQGIDEDDTDAGQYFRCGVLYLGIYIGGFVFLFLYNVATGIFSALGDSRTPLYFLMASSVGNILLDYLFVAKFDWGVAGVAWATFIAQGIAGVLALITMAGRLGTLETEGRAKLFSWEMLRKISQIAVPSIFQQSFISIGNIFIQGLVNSFGSSVIAGYSAAIKLNTFAITSFTTLGNGISNFTAQNMGAGKKERVREGFQAGIRMAMLVVIPFFIAFFLTGETMIRLFMKADSTVALQTGIQFLHIISPFYFVVAAKLMADGVLRGAGAMKQFMAATFVDLVLRVILAFLLAGRFGSLGIWLSWPIGWIVATVLSIVFYRKNFSLKVLQSGGG